MNFFACKVYIYFIFYTYFFESFVPTLSLAIGHTLQNKHTLIYYNIFLNMASFITHILRTEIRSKSLFLTLL